MLDEQVTRQMEYLKKLYESRFNPQERKAKLALWKVLVNNFLQNYVTVNDTVLDIGGGSFYKSLKKNLRKIRYN